MAFKDIRFASKSQVLKLLSQKKNNNNNNDNNKTFAFQNRPYKLLSCPLKALYWFCQMDSLFFVIRAFGIKVL